MQTRSSCLLVAICQEWMAGAAFRATPSLCASPTVVRFWSKWGSSHVPTSIHLHLAQPYVICSISYELLTKGSGEKRNGVSFTKQFIAHTHILHLICIKIMPVFFFKAVSRAFFVQKWSWGRLTFRIMVMSTEETKLCLRHLCFWPNMLSDLSAFPYFLHHVPLPLLVCLSHIW